MGDLAVHDRAGRGISDEDDFGDATGQPQTVETVVAVVGRGGAVAVDVHRG